MPPSGPAHLSIQRQEPFLTHPPTAFSAPDTENRACLHLSVTQESPLSDRHDKHYSL